MGKKTISNLRYMESTGMLGEMQSRMSNLFSRSNSAATLDKNGMSCTSLRKDENVRETKKFSRDRQGSNASTTSRTINKSFNPGTFKEKETNQRAKRAEQALSSHTLRSETGSKKGKRSNKKIGKTKSNF